VRCQILFDISCSEVCVWILDPGIQFRRMPSAGTTTEMDGDGKRFVAIRRYNVGRRKYAVWISIGCPAAQRCTKAEFKQPSESCRRSDRKIDSAKFLELVCDSQNEDALLEHRIQFLEAGKLFISSSMLEAEKRSIGTFSPERDWLR
jgi:hypothetical protein